MMTSIFRTLVFYSCRCLTPTSVNFICIDIIDYANYGLIDCGSHYAPFFYSFFIIILLIMNLLVGIMINVSSLFEETSGKSC